jgi:hypothetical protein
MYKLCPKEPKEQSQWVIRLSDGALIRTDGDGPGPQEYLRWLEAGNTPEPAEENT